MKILLTGASGFLGRHLLEALKSEGHELFYITHVPQVNSSGIFWDFRGDLPDLPKVDIIVHLAALVDFSREFQAPQYEVNTLATARLAAYAKKHDIGMIFTSTVSVHGDQRPLGINTPVMPNNHYGISKWLAEESIRYIAARWIIARLHGIYGLGGPAHLGLNRSISEAYHQHTAPTLNGTGLAKRNYINVLDAARWLAALCRRPQDFTCQTIYMASSEVLSIRAYLGSISRILADGKPVQEFPGGGGEDMCVLPAASPVGLTSFEDYLRQLAKQRADKL